MHQPEPAHDHPVHTDGALKQVQDEGHSSQARDSRQRFRERVASGRIGAIEVFRLDLCSLPHWAHWLHGGIFSRQTEITLNS